MAKNNEHIKKFLQDEYKKWLYAHKQYINTKQVNILAQFMPSKNYESKDYNLSSFCVFFHLALVNELTKPENLSRDFGHSECFYLTYCKREVTQYLAANPSVKMARCVKELAINLGVTNVTVTTRGHAIAERVWRRAQASNDDMLAVSEMKKLLQYK
jgi:hypothetical protein